MSLLTAPAVVDPAIRGLIVKSRAVVADFCRNSAIPANMLEYRPGLPFLTPPVAVDPAIYPPVVRTPVLVFEIRRYAAGFFGVTALDWSVSLELGFERMLQYGFSMVQMIRSGRPALLAERAISHRMCAAPVLPENLRWNSP